MLHIISWESPDTHRKKWNSPPGNNPSITCHQWTLILNQELDQSSEKPQNAALTYFVFIGYNMAVGFLLY